MHIRPARAEDFPAISVLFEEGDALHRSELPHLFQDPESPGRSSNWLRSLVEDEDKLLLVAETEGYVAGLLEAFIREAPPFPIFRPRRTMYVASVITGSAFRRHGIARALMMSAEEIAAKQNCEAVELSVFIFNEPALALYAGLGYETTALRMSKELR